MEMYLLRLIIQPDKENLFLQINLFLFCDMHNTFSMIPPSYLVLKPFLDVTHIQ